MPGPLIPFDTALTRFAEHLASNGWPAPIHFVPESNVLLQRPPRALLLRLASADPLIAGRLAYAEAQRISVPAELLGVGHRDGLVYACVRVLVDPAQGQDMFIREGIQLSTLVSPRSIHFCQSRLRWRFASWAEARRITRAAARISPAA